MPGYRAAGVRACWRAVVRSPHTPPEDTAPITPRQPRVHRVRVRAGDGGVRHSRARGVAEAPRTPARVVQGSAGQSCRRADRGACQARYLGTWRKACTCADLTPPCRRDHAKNTTAARFIIYR